MAEAGIIERFYALHGSNSHEHNFKVEIIFEGEIDKETGFVADVDFHEIIPETKKIISELKNQNLNIILTKKGYKTSSVESIARYFIKTLINKFPIKYIKIWETDTRYVTVYSNEI